MNKRKKGHYKRLCGLILLFAFCSGCSLFGQSPRLTQRIILQSTGADMQNGVVTLSGNAFIATQNEGAGKVVSLLGRGSTVAEAAEDMADATGGAPYFSHNRAVIIGRKTAEEGIRPLITFFSEYRECRGTATMYVCNGNAADFIRQAGKDEAMTAGPDELARIAAKSGNAPETAVWQAAQALSDHERDFVLPLLVSEDDTVAVRGCAVFADDKMVCTMNEAETRGLLLLCDQLPRCRITVETASYGKVTAEAEGLCRKLSVSLTDGAPHFSVSLSGICRPIEWTAAEPADAEARRECAALCGEQVKAWMEEAIAVAFAHGADVFSFGRLFRKQFPNEAADISAQNSFPNGCSVEISVTLSDENA